MNAFFSKRTLALMAIIQYVVFVSSAQANGVHGRGGLGGHAGHVDTGTEFTIQADYFNIGTSRSSLGNAQVDTSGIRIETEYEINYWTFEFNYERWNYSWSNPELLPFIAGQRIDPWSTFQTFQLGLEYEQEISDRWEIYYYAEAESTFEREMANSNEYEIGIDFNFEQSKSWTYTLNVNWEYLDAEGSEFGVDFEIEWNDHATEGWSGVFEVSSEFPESSISYHFKSPWFATLFFEEGGTNTVRLANNSPVIGMQRGYLEDEYIGIGLRVGYELGHDSYFSVYAQQNSERELSFVDSTGKINRTYQFDDSYEFGIRFAYQFTK